MDIKSLHDKILVVDGLFDEQEYAKVAAEIAELRPRIEPTYHLTDVVLYRAPLDQVYDDRKRSFILQVLPTKLYCDAILEACEGLNDLSYTLINKQHNYTTTLSEFRGDTNYRKHTDTGEDQYWTQIFMSWIWYYNPHPERFTGGELVAWDYDEAIEPRDNRLVLLPAYLEHSVNPAVSTVEGYYRTTLNGFYTWNESQGAQATSTEQGIENALASGQGGVTADLVLPRPNGQLDLVRATAARTIDRMESAGQDVGNASTHLRRGDNCFQQGRYRDAFANYRKAYRRAVGVDLG